MNDKEIHPLKPDIGGIGRANFIKENEPVTTNTIRDISDMDREEGDMNHGAKGGNFDQDSQEVDNQEETT
ncbi:MAG TPA: hypothetical protein VJ499_06730 [Flavisolibacter sp.]|nr:hypothetical protein [Flavisolibacter sp.]